MKLKQIKPNLYLATFKNQYLCASTFIRLQEFYESPYAQIRGKYFCLEDYMDIYAKDQKGYKFTYFTDWNGFNVPGNIVKKFHRLFKKTLSGKEKELITPLLGKGKFYLIGCVNKDKMTVNHEIAHGLFYLNDSYKNKMLALLVNNVSPMIKDTKIWLLNRGYYKQVLNDEIQAYFSTGIDEGMIQKKNRDLKYLRKFKEIFKWELKSY